MVNAYRKPQVDGRFIVLLPLYRGGQYVFAPVSLASGSPEVWALGPACQSLDTFDGPVR